MTEYPTAQINPTSRFSLIWLIPLVAALIGGWLIYKHYSGLGTIITIILDDASGVEAKKTPIRYKSVQVGKVKKVGLTADLKKVKVTAEIYPEMAQNLTSNTRFWIVKPRISFQGISGLDTLLSGVHIGMDPRNIDNENDLTGALETYIGLSKAPIIGAQEKGTSLTLNTSKLGSLDISSPVYYRKIKVGEVTGYHLNPNDESIDVSIFVHAPYDKRIKSSSRFWNASGLELELSTGGISVRMESLAALVIGGIAFETSNNEAGYPIDGDTSFRLYESYKLANDDTQRNNKIFYVMYFSDTLHGLSEDSVIEYNGVKVGKVESILLESSKNSTQVKTLVKVSFRIDKFSTKGDKKEAEQTLRNLVQDGLFAQLTVDSLLTGAQYIALKTVTNPEIRKSANTFALLPTHSKYTSVFPTIRSKQSLLNFDASEITQELNLAISSVTALINSKDVKKILKGLGSTSESISKITKKLDKGGFSGKLVKTLETAERTTQDIRKLISDSRHTVVVLGNVANKLQKNISHSLRTVDNVGNKVQQDVRRTLNGIDRVTLTLNKGLKNTLSEDSALQYRLQQLINDLSEASNSFSILADTLQRKPNSIIFGK